MGLFSPSMNELTMIANGYHGWAQVNGLGPNYFAHPEVEAELVEFLGKKRPPLSCRAKMSLAIGRACMVNSFNLIDDANPLNLRPYDTFLPEVDTFLEQLGTQVEIWRNGIFRALSFSGAEESVYLQVVAKSAPVLFSMGFADAIPHSAQVSRLTASMVETLEGHPSEILQGAIVGWLHDPKFHPSIDLGKQNLATHPINASALAWCLFRDPAIARLTLRLRYLNSNPKRFQDFTSGIVDAVGINNDSRFVNMMVILPAITKRVADIYGTKLGEQFRAIVEARLESASKGIVPAPLPVHLHGALAHIRLDSGLRGISRIGWARALDLAGIVAADGDYLFYGLIHGIVSLPADQAVSLRSALRQADAILRAEVQASTLLHHHQEVCKSGRKAAEALVTADPMMLSPHKVASVYTNALIDRLTSYVGSFDDNIRLLPRGGQSVGKRWQRAVYLSMLGAADFLNNSKLVPAFKAAHTQTLRARDIDDLRAIVLSSATWGAFGQASGVDAAVRRSIGALEWAYVTVVDQFRSAIYYGVGEEALDRFYPDFTQGQQVEPSGAA